MNQNHLSSLSVLLFLIQMLQPVDTLKEEFTKQSIRNQIDELGQSYSHWRRVRGDGNCFFRATYVGALEYAISHDGSTEFLSRCKCVLEGGREACIKLLGCSNSCFDEFV